MQWHAASKNHPAGGSSFVLLCVDQDDSITHALGWFKRGSNEWIITAYPIGSEPKEIIYWCELPSTPERYAGGDSWPAVVPYVEQGIVQLQRQ